MLSCTMATLTQCSLIDFKNGIVIIAASMEMRHTKVHHYCELNLIEGLMEIFKYGGYRSYDVL